MLITTSWSVDLRRRPDSFWINTMFSIHATKKLLDRVKPAQLSAVEHPATVLGNWYATALLWKPHIALLVNEKTLLPVLLPLAPAATLAERFPPQLGRVLAACGVNQEFIASELAQMTDVRFAKTANRRVLGMMNQFSFMAESYRDYLDTSDLLTLSMKLADTPCSPLYKGHVFPYREVMALAQEWQSRRGGSGVEDSRQPLQVLEKIKRGDERAAAEGSLTHEQVKQRLGKWMDS